MTETTQIIKKLVENRIPIVIVGPTATGKSGLAVMLAEKLNGEIISLDSMQVYIGMDIGTGKIPISDRRGIPHHLIDVIHPNKVFSAGEFQRLAEEKSDAVWRNGKTSIIVGGTGLYLRAFLKGLLSTPDRNDTVRKRIKTWENREGLDSLYKFLIRTDPKIDEIIKPADRQRIHRALEIYLVTGKTPSSLRESSGFAEDRFQAIKIGLGYSSRDLLYESIEKRVDAMFNEGWIDEVKTLRDKFQSSIHPFKAIGYREIIEYLEGKASLESTISLIKQKTRNYAKRQITWYKKEEAIKWFDAGEDKELVCREVLKYISAYIKDEGELNNGSRAD